MWCTSTAETEVPSFFWWVLSNWCIQKHWLPGSGQSRTWLVNGRVQRDSSSFQIKRDILVKEREGGAKLEHWRVGGVEAGTLLGKGGSIGMPHHIRRSYARSASTTQIVLSWSEGGREKFITFFLASQPESIELQTIARIVWICQNLRSCMGFFW